MSITRCHSYPAKWILFLFLAVLTHLQGLTQNPKTAEPEFSGTIIFADTTSSGKNLETATMTVKTKGNASLYITGIGKATSFGIVKGKTSTCILSAQPTLSFVYRAKSNSVNPKDVIQLARFTISKDGNRVMPIVSATTFSSTSNEVIYLDFAAKKYGRSSYIVTVTDLAPGEYGFSLGKESTYTVHLFTVR
ncbi:hypothetical protein ACLOAU_15360 [Niabella sp. CJ426]|uniref:hypothetical protein n=1 Tax=Niabella sp. CJ426 TaxID=3393740 RepID=UPI003D0280E8